MEKMSQNDPNVGLGPLSKSKIKPFDPRALLDVFQHSIHMLAEVSERNQRRVEKLEHVCTRQEMEHNGRIRELEGTYQASVWCRRQEGSLVHRLSPPSQLVHVHMYDL